MTPNSAATSSAIPLDVIDTHILPKLDGPTLASTGCVSSQLHALSLKGTHWRNLCHATWPSINHPTVRDVIVSTFPPGSGYRSFFRGAGGYCNSSSSLGAATRELISAVDMRYKNRVVFSNMQVTDTLTEGFLYWPLCFDLLNPTGTATSPVKFTVDEEESLAGIAEHLTLSWIAIDPARKLTANLSSLEPVLVQPHYLTGYIQLRYSTLVAAGELRIVVTCGGLRGDESGDQVVAVKEVNLQVVDMDGRVLNGRESLVILQGAMESTAGNGNWKRGDHQVMIMRESYEQRLKERRERRVQADAAAAANISTTTIMDLARLLTIFVACVFWIIWHRLSRYYNYVRTRNIGNH